MTLIDIGHDLQTLLLLLEESGGEVLPEHEAAIDAWFAEIGAKESGKIDGYVALIREFTLRAAARTEECERLKMRVAADENAAKRSKERLKLYMEMTQQKTIETPRYKVTVAKNGGRVPIDVAIAPTSLPPEFQRVKIEADVDRI